MKLPVRAVHLVYSCQQGTNCRHGKAHRCWFGRLAFGRCLQMSCADQSCSSNRLCVRRLLNEWPARTLWFTQRKCIFHLIAFITHAKLSCRAIDAVYDLPAYSLIAFAHPFPGYGANSSCLLLYLQSPSPGVKLEMKPARQGTELHKPPSVLSPGSHHLHYSVWGSFGSE